MYMLFVMHSSDGHCLFIQTYMCLFVIQVYVHVHIHVYIYM